MIEELMLTGLMHPIASIVVWLCLMALTFIAFGFVCFRLGRK